MFFHALNVVRIFIIVDALLSWFLRDSEFPRSMTKAITDPVYEPMREVLQPHTGRVDFSPLIALLALQLLQFAVQKAGYGRLPK